MTTDDHARAPGIPIDRLDDLAMLGSLAAFADDGAEALGELASTVSRFRRPAKHEVVREGEVLDAASADSRVHGVRALFEMIANEPRLSATAVQTVGAKKWDGFVLAVVEPV